MRRKPWSKHNECKGDQPARPEGNKNGKTDDTTRLFRVLLPEFRNIFCGCHAQPETGKQPKHPDSALDNSQLAKPGLPQKPCDNNRGQQGKAAGYDRACNRPEGPQGESCPDRSFGKMTLL